VVFLKILVCLSSWYPHYTSSSIGVIVDEVSKELKKRGNVVYICSPVGGDIELIKPDIIKKTKNFELMNHYYRIFLFWNKCLRYIIKNYCEYDIIWVHHPIPYLWIFLNRYYYKKIIITQHTTFTGISKKSPYTSLKFKLYFFLMRWFEKLFFKKLRDIKNKITVISPVVIDEIEKLGISKDRIIYIPNGVNVYKYKIFNLKMKNIIKEKYEIPKDKIILISVGRLIDSKHPLDLIKTFKIIDNEKFYLNILGKGDLFNKIKFHSKGYKNIKIWGYVDEKTKRELMSASDYYVSASRYEGQPLALLESMSSGLGCITNNIPNITHIIEDANCGFTVDFSNYSDAANKIENILKIKNNKFNKNARKFIEKKHDWNIVAKNYEELFEKMI